MGQVGSHGFFNPYFGQIALIWIGLAFPEILMKHFLYVGVLFLAASVTANLIHFSGVVLAISLLITSVGILILEKMRPLFIKEIPFSQYKPYSKSEKA